MPYKQRVTGSNPVTPTTSEKGFRNYKSETFFCVTTNVITSWGLFSSGKTVTGFIIIKIKVGQITTIFFIF